MSAHPFHKRYHSDALAGFISLNLEERGAYQTILDMIYDRGGPIIDNDRLLSGYMQCSPRKWRAIRGSLLSKGKIKLTGDGHLTNVRAEKEIENAAKTSRKLAESGSKGGKSRAEKSQKSNENNEGDEASLKAGSSLRARSRSQIPEDRNNTGSSELDTPRRTAAMPDDLRQVMQAANMTAPPCDTGLLSQWRAIGADLEHCILPTVRRLTEAAAKPPWKLKFFDAAIREQHAADQREIEHYRAVSQRFAGGMA